MNTDDKIVTFESYYDPMLAHIIRSRLEANGISCFIADENTIGANPLYNQAVGGVKLKIFERDLEKCREILATEGDLHEQDHFEIDEETNTYVVCPYCASTNVSNIAGDKDKDQWPVLGTIMNLVNPFNTQMNWHCNNCQREFE
jgi:DNA-directed RNA polymerase subunit RPC12/RpoP